MIEVSIEQIPALQDNYIYVLHDSSYMQTAIVDPSEGKPVLDFLKKRGFKADFIFNTHHHWDHVGGNQSIKAETGCKVLTSPYDRNRIEGADGVLQPGEMFKFGNSLIHIFEIPGHTLGHIALWIESAQALFCGDTLFGLGCGRLFEGTAAQMWNSLQKIRKLPDSTKVYCGHEYTLKNCEFALNLEPNNKPLAEFRENLEDFREKGKSTVPTVLGEEKRLNPFLRADEPAFQKRLGFEEGADPVRVFAHLRKLKDAF